MTEARRADSIREVGTSQPSPAFKVRTLPVPHHAATKPQSTARLLTLREIEHEFGLTGRQVYALANAGLIEALQRDGKGRVFYSEGQIRTALRGSYGELTAAAA